MWCRQWVPKYLNIKTMMNSIELAIKVRLNWILIYSKTNWLSFPPFSFPQILTTILWPLFPLQSSHPPKRRPSIPFDANLVMQLDGMGAGAESKGHGPFAGPIFGRKGAYEGKRHFGCKNSLEGAKSNFLGQEGPPRSIQSHLSPNSRDLPKFRKHLGDKWMDGPVLRYFMVIHYPNNPLAYSEDNSKSIKATIGIHIR